MNWRASKGSRASGVTAVMEGEESTLEVES
jgi:hypothetical protein